MAGKSTKATGRAMKSVRTLKKHKSPQRAAGRPKTGRAKRAGKIDHLVGAVKDAFDGVVDTVKHTVTRREK
jgi:hypothetical protein